MFVVPAITVGTVVPTMIVGTAVPTIFVLMVYYWKSCLGTAVSQVKMKNHKCEKCWRHRGIIK